MATHSSVLALRIPGTGEPGGLPSMGSNRVGQDWSDLAAAAAVLSYPLRCMQVNSQRSGKCVRFELHPVLISFEIGLKLSPRTLLWSVLSVPNWIANLTEELSILFYWFFVQNILYSALYTMTTPYSLLLVSDTSLCRGTSREHMWWSNVAWPMVLEELLTCVMT